jgi:hypothetical protein
MFRRPRAGIVTGNVLIRAAPAVLLTAILCGCQSVPEYSPPPQRPSFAAFKARAARVVSMDDPDASLHFARDIFDGSKTSWEWTGQRPAVKVRIRSGARLKYVIDFTLPEVTFKVTGPVTLTFTVNDKVLDRVRYTAQGHQHFEKAVPEGWVEPNQYAIAGAEIDKVWVSQTDGARLGFILSRLGLEEAGQ